MKAKSKQARWIILLGILGMIVLGVLASQQEQAEIQVEGYLDPEHKIRYIGGHDAESNDTFFVEPIWRGNYVTLDEIEYYTQASRSAGQHLLDAGVHDFYVGVTFRDYMSPEEFEGFVPEMGIKVTQFMLRATFPILDPGTRVGVFGVPSGEKIIDSEQLARLYEDLRSQAMRKKADKVAVQRSGEADADWQSVLESEEFKAITVSEGDAVLNGVYTFEAITDREGYQRLLEDPRVYHIDVTATLVYQQLKAYGIKWEDFLVRPNLGGYDPFWSMENLGLENFQ